MPETKFKSHQGPHKLDGFYYEGIATHVYLTKLNKEVIIISPTQEELTYFYGRIAVNIMDPKHCKPGVYGAASKLEKIDGEKESIPEYPKHDYNYYWYIHQESGCCFMEYNNFSSGDGCTEQLGIAEQQTIDECKALMRKLRMPRSVIESISISTQEPIPF